MRKQCPNCESFDVQLNEKNHLVCFTCFNIFSSDNLNEKRVLATLPPFPEELERKNDRRKGTRGRISNDPNSSPYRRVIA